MKTVEENVAAYKVQQNKMKTRLEILQEQLDLHAAMYDDCPHEIDSTAINDFNPMLATLEEILLQFGLEEGDWVEIDR